MESNMKIIECPSHQGSEHVATLYQRGHEWAGIWECPMTGESDSCEHLKSHVEEVAEDHMGFNGHYQTESQVYVCDDCDETLEGSPEADNAESYMEMVEN